MLWRRRKPSEPHKHRITIRVVGMSIETQGMIAPPSDFQSVTLAVTFPNGRSSNQTLKLGGEIQFELEAEGRWITPEEEAQ